jgi:hypothetical protein
MTALEHLHKGCLLLKKEVNGLHLRFFVLERNNKLIYWLKAKRDVLKVEESDKIYINEIEQIVVHSDAQLINTEEAKEYFQYTVWSLSITIIVPNNRVVINFPSVKFESFFFLNLF